MMTPPPARQISTLHTTPLRHDLCYRCDGPSVYLIHDARGCVPACESCATWREHQSVVEGHAKDCPERKPDE